VISPRPKERLRMISTRRAREADLDKDDLRQGGAIYSWIGPNSRAEPVPSTARWLANPSKWRSSGPPESARRVGIWRHFRGPGAMLPEALLANAQGTPDDH